MAATQNTLIVINDTTIAANIKPALLETLRICSQLTRFPLSRFLNRGIELFLELEGGQMMGTPEAVERAKKLGIEMDYFEA